MVVKGVLRDEWKRVRAEAVRRMAEAGVAADALPPRELDKQRVPTGGPEEGEPPV